MYLKNYLGVAFAASLACAGQAQAQEPTVGEAAGAPPGEAALAAPAEGVDEAGEKDKDPMAWIGIGMKLGFAGNGEGEFEAGGVTTTIDSRSGFQLSVPINMGGDGFGWIIEPYMNFASLESADATGAKKDYGVTTIGAFTGPVYNIHIMDPLYVGIGAGLKAGYAKSDAFDFGADIMGRLAVTGTYYVLDDIGAVAEFGLGRGLTGFATKPYTDPTTNMLVEPDLEFGSAWTWDFSVGARWP